MKHANNILAIIIIVTLALSVFGAINVTTAPTVDAARIGTKIDLYVHPIWFGVSLIPTPYAKSVPHGRWALVGIVMMAADHKYPCSPTE